MQRGNKLASRRTLVGVGLTVGAAAAMAVAGRGDAAAAQDLGPKGDQGKPADFAFGRTDEGNLRADDASLSQRARDLIRIGMDGIARENTAAMMAFFHPSFRFHGPGGAELDRDRLFAYFAACRAAFDDFSVTRQALVSDGGDYLATRTRFAGIFARPFTASPKGTLEPNGKRFSYDLVNIFRYAANGRLAEEWLQYDTQSFLAQLQRSA
ncbi:ester cyclase [Methylobacterium oryzisoli]|uniref:ester cyclase n=1 Tax=Methylobacterium oryzisoli TaxID=3385502 RepID=UPI0038923A3B